MVFNFDLRSKFENPNEEFDRDRTAFSYTMKPVEKEKAPLKKEL